MKECSKCKTSKAKEEFNRSKRSKDGLQSCCRECQKKSQSKWRENNPSYNSEHRQNNKDKFKEYYENSKNNKGEIKQKEYRDEDRIHKEYMEYYESNRDKINKKNREYYKNNKEELDRKHREYYKQKTKKDIVKIYDDYISNNYPSGNVQYGVIYGVYNKVTDRWYIGQTTSSFKIRYNNNFFNRKPKEMCETKSTLFLDDLNKYGEKSFEIYEVLDVAFSPKELDEKEVYYIDYYKAYDEGYNSNRGFINGRDTLYK